MVTGGGEDLAKGLDSGRRSSPRLENGHSPSLLVSWLRNGKDRKTPPHRLPVLATLLRLQALPSGSSPWRLPSDLTINKGAQDTHPVQAMSPLYWVHWALGVKSGRIQTARSV